MVEKIWANSYILYGLTNEEKEYVQLQLKRFNKIEVDIFNDIYAYPAFLIIINPASLTNEEVKEFNKKYPNIEVKEFTQFECRGEVICQKNKKNKLFCKKM